MLASLRPHYMELECSWHFALHTFPLLSLQSKMTVRKSVQAGTSHGLCMALQSVNTHKCSNASCDGIWYEAELVPPHDLLQALITNALQAVLPPNCTFTAVTMIQQLDSDTVIVDAQFQLRESQLAVLLANKCCDLEVLFLQQAVQRIDTTVVGECCSCEFKIGLCFTSVHRMSNAPRS